MIFIILLLFRNNQDSIDIFVEEHFIQENGEIQTYSNGNGRLTESIGLYMEYLIMEDKEEAFENQATQVRSLMEDGFMYWREKDAHSNASVDDLRIMRSLYKAGSKWDSSSFTEMADEIQQFLLHNQIRDSLIVDLYDKKSERASTEVHLSYIDARAIRYFPESVQERHASLLQKVNKEVFFPEVYQIPNDQFRFNDEVNMIDQTLIATNANRLSIQTKSFFRFIEEEFESKGKVYGRYDRKTLQPTVQYESPSVYALLVIGFLENSRVDLANKAFDRMKALQSKDGGYKGPDDTAHFFDNILPLIAQKRWHMNQK